MAELSTSMVEEIFGKCLYKEGESPEAQLEVEGVLRSAVFNRQRLEQHRQEIFGMLLELPDAFMQSGGGGMSLMNACCDRYGRQWTGLQVIMEGLMMLGIAVEKVRPLFPRMMWSALPGGMPYYVVLDNKDNESTK